MKKIAMIFSSVAVRGTTIFLHVVRKQLAAYRKLFTESGRKNERHFGKRNNIE